MAGHLDHLQMAKRHLAEADARIARQRSLIAELVLRGQPTDLAEQLLESLIATREQMGTHYIYLAGQSGA
jgi:Fe2+ or Zn2+ uptake regulation protein